MSDLADEMMPSATLKAALKGAQEPGTLIPVAIGLDADKNAIVLAARRGKSKTTKKTFIATVKKKKLDLKTDAQSLFFGYGSTEKGAESILKLTLNRNPPGGDVFAHKVFTRVKGAGFGKVVLAFDANLEKEKDEEEEAQEAEVAAAQTRLHDDGALKRALAQLIPAVAKLGQTDPKAAEPLKQLAAAAGEALKGGKLVDAATALGRLKTALDVATQTAPAAGKADLVKPRLIWLASRKKAREETAKLRSKLHDHYGPQGIAKAIVARYDGVVDELFRELDDSLADTLDAANTATGDQRTELLAGAKRTVERYQAAVANPRLKALENNPFERLALSDMLSTSLKALSSNLR